jgi:hypothetical protein
MQGHPGCRCEDCEAGIPHKLVKDYSLAERVALEAKVARAFGEPPPLRMVPPRPVKAKRFGGNTRQPWMPRPARTAA